MKPTPLLTGWTCRHLGDTAPGKPVTLPHDAMLAEPRTALSAGGTNTGWYEGYDCAAARWWGWAAPAPSTSTAIWTAKPIPTTARLLP